MRLPAPRLASGWKWHLLRRFSQVAVLLLGVAVPWCNLFRLDMPANQVVYFGRHYPLEWPYVLGMIVPFLVLIWGLALLSWLKGRVFCGWACPYGSLVEWFDGLRTALGSGSSRKVATWMRRSPLHRWGLRLAAGATLALAPLLLGASLAAYLYPPARILAELSAPLDLGNQGQLVLWAWMALTVLASWVAGWIVRFHFCRMVCIYGMGQAMAASSRAPEKVLRPRYRPEELSACGSCQACLKACFLELDPRETEIHLGFSTGCFNCGDCIDVCTTVQAHKQQPALLTFTAPPAKPGTRRRLPAAPLEEDGF